jgi:hypothetical protein
MLMFPRIKVDNIMEVSSAEVSCCLTVVDKCYGGIVPLPSKTTMLLYFPKESMSWWLTT